MKMQITNRKDTLINKIQIELLTIFHVDSTLVFESLTYYNERADHASNSVMQHVLSTNTRGQ